MARVEQMQWTLCCEWLQRVGLIRSDHLLATDQANLTDLCIFLRDGVMLCELLHLLDRNSIQLWTINKRPHRAQFLCLKNIGIFLQKCEQEFGLHKSDLFKPLMLFESSDIKKVLQTLSKLSNCPKAQRLNIPGFPEESDLDNVDNDIYEYLERDMANGLAGDPTSLRMEIQESLYDDVLGDDRIYAELRLCSRRQLEEENIYEEVEHIYDAFEIPVDAAVPRVEAPDLTRKRDLCLQEIVETENNYVTALNMLCTKFLEPLKRKLHEEQIKKIFGCIPELARIHQALHRDLKDAQNNTSGKTISEVFLENQEQLIIYGEYCANLAAAQQEVEDVVSNNEEVRNLIQECQSEVSDDHSQLKGYLVVPVQRILKYHLLLHELVRHTPATHSEFGDLKRAHEAMRDLAEYINEVKRDKEDLQIIQDLQNSIMEMPSDINDWQELGKLRHDGETKIECHPEPIRKRYVFVFDKVMVICSKQTRDENYFYENSVRLENCRVENSGGKGTGSSTRGRQNSFSLVVDVNKKAYTIITKDSDSKEKWMKSISDAIEYLNPSKNQEMKHSFAITTFSRPNTRCEMCNKLLKGTIFQGYKCSKCELVTHMNCLNGVQRCEGSNLYPGYGNLQLQQYAWWVEEMTRTTASDRLLHQPQGTFLIRWSDRYQKLVLSLKVENRVKHMRIFKHEESSDFYLSEVRYFHSLDSLVRYYGSNCLSECFSNLFAYLIRPLYEVAIANFPYRGTGRNHLSLELGDRVIVTSHDGENNGWWKGRIDNRVGYFPKNFVRIQIM
ncbi:protein vav-like isoform X11 [Eriocheir sinensis]|uniref:protein vav-like isoform X11 n=1 Tax=Eriocheir sinensis TaxID=95602 RepID=UPI0021C966FB|nr:protein vav-like isoform X11 [Eriocheir sinensis]